VARDPAAVFEYVRDRVLQGDGEAQWRVLLPEARARWEAFVKEMIARPEGDPQADSWRHRAGVSRAEIAAMTPERAMARDVLSLRREFEGARVASVDRWTEDLVLLTISLRSTTIHWVMKERNGRWMVYDMEPQVNSRWLYTPPDGGPPIQVFAPGTSPPESAPDPGLRRRDPGGGGPR
jgi:hypothetical protein